jgi:hypothetical protein
MNTITCQTPSQQSIHDICPTTVLCLLARYSCLVQRVFSFHNYALVTRDQNDKRYCPYLQSIRITRPEDKRLELKCPSLWWKLAVEDTKRIAKLGFDPRSSGL